MVHPTPKMSQPARAVPRDFSKARQRPALVTVKRPGAHVGRTDKTR